MLSRRDLVGRLAAGTAAAFAVVVRRPDIASALVRAGIDPSAGDALRTDAVTPAGITQDLQAASQAASNDTNDQLAGLSKTADTFDNDGATPWHLLHPLTPGSVVAHGWRVAELSAVTGGACVLTLKNQRGRMHRVHLCRNDGRPQGLVYTDQIDLVVMNGGRGDLPTEEGLAQAVAEVAHVLAANEAGRRQQSLELMSHAERLQRFATIADARLR